MDAFLPALIVAALAELGDRTQLLAMLLSARFRAPALVLLGIALAAAANMALAAVAGLAFASVANHRAVQLMTGLALVLGGSGAAFHVKAPPTVATWRLGALLSAFGAFFILAFGDKTQFVAAAIAGGSGKPMWTAIGATLGIVLANVPAVVLGERWPALVPLRAIRIVVGVVLVLAGLVIAIRALGIG